MRKRSLGNSGLAYTRLMEQGKVITAPIASATNLHQLNELIRATQLKLDAAAMQLLDRASDWRM